MLNPQNPWKGQRKHQHNPGISLLKIYQGNQKNRGKEVSDILLPDIRGLLMSMLHVCLTPTW